MKAGSTVFNSPSPTAPGITSKPSAHTVAETVQRLQTVILNHGLTLFATIDHSGAAEQAGLAMPPTVLLIAGSPKAGTPLMRAAPLLAIDLPLKALVWEDAGGHVWVSAQDPAWLAARFGVSDALLPNISGFTAVIDAALRG